MGVETAADRAVFVNTDDFGATGVYTPAGGGPSDDIAGIFDDPTRSVDINEAASIDARPTFCCREDDIPDGAVGDAGDEIEITVDGQDMGTFKVWSIEPDGQGFALLRLGATD